MTSISLTVENFSQFNMPKIITPSTSISLKDMNYQELVEGCIAGDEKFKKHLYESLYTKMLGVCLRYASNKDDAKDILHDGFIKVFEKLHTFKHLGSFEGWVRRIIVNTAVDNIRKNKNVYTESTDDLIFENLAESSKNELEEHEDAILSKIKVERIIEMMQLLTPVYRTVFNLFVIEDYSHKQIADMLNVTVGTSKANLSKAKRNLRRLYFKHYENNE